MPSRGGQRYDRSDSEPPVQGLSLLQAAPAAPWTRPPVRCGQPRVWVKNFKLEFKLETEPRDTSPY